MTDAEAKKLLRGTREGLIEARAFPGWPPEMARHYAAASALDVAAIDHALQAIEDRQALIDAAYADSDCYSDQPGKMLPGTVAVVRLHVNEEG